MRGPRLLVCLVACAALHSCKPAGPGVSAHKFDTVAFVLTSPPPISGNPVPSVWLDSKMEVDGLFGGGTVESKKPYDIRIDYTDNTATFTALEISRLKVVYDDGEVEDAVNGLPLPHRIPVRAYETVNSTSGGGIVKATVKILSGTLPDVINRDESLTLTMEGFFATNSGTKQPFTIHHHYTVSFDKASRPLEDR